MQKVSVNDEKCIRCGMCIANCGEVFNYGQDGESVVIKELVEDDDMQVIMAKEGCPTDAISLTPVKEEECEHDCKCEHCECENCECSKNE